MDKSFYRFLQATCCNWRNSFFIDCQHCSDRYDCVGVMTLEGFQRIYTSWLVWNVADPNRCSLSQMWESCQQ